MIPKNGYENRIIARPQATYESAKGAQEFSPG
jgi:hypothetical protein